MAQIDKEKIKKLITSGFDLELISFEFDIPMEQVKQCQQELENRSIANDSEENTVSKDVDKEKNRKPINVENPTSNGVPAQKTYGYFKMKEMRERYKKLLSSSKVETKQTKSLSEKEAELIETTISAIEEKIQQMQDLSRAERRKIILDILSKVNKIKEYPLSIEQAEKLNHLVNCKELDFGGKIDQDIFKMKRALGIQLAKAIEMEIPNIENIEKLQELQLKLTPEIRKKNEVLIGGIASRILRKISELQQKQAIDRIKNNIPENINAIITDLANGKVDIKKANSIIDAEAKKRVETKPKNMFRLTQEQERNQILIQIRTAIKDRADKYPIENPEVTVLQMEELCGKRMELTLGAVVRNLINRKQYQIARDVCEKFSKQHESPQIRHRTKKRD